MSEQQGIRRAGEKHPQEEKCFQWIGPGKVTLLFDISDLHPITVPDLLMTGGALLFALFVALVWRPAGGLGVLGLLMLWAGVKAAVGKAAVLRRVREVERPQGGIR